MRKILKNKILIASFLFTFLDLLQGFLVLAPFFIFLRTFLEKSGAALKLWPFMSVDVLGDIVINNSGAIGMFLISAVVIYVVYIPLKTLAAGAIYGLIIFRNDDGRISPANAGDFLRLSTDVWIGFIKVAVFGVIVYLVALFLGISFGEIFGRFSKLLRLAVVFIFLLAGSTLLQILRINIISSGDISLRTGFKSILRIVPGSLVRLLIGNISVAAAGLAVVLILFIGLKGIKNMDWNPARVLVSIVLQQMIVFVVCLGQSIRINFNYSVMKRGEDDALGRAELG